MTSSIIEKIKLLPATKQQEVEDFINFLAQKYLSENEFSITIERDRKKNAGRLSGKIKMAEDFNAIPEDFQDYN